MTNKSFGAIVCIGICLLFGCRESKDNVPVESYYIQTNRLIEKEDLMVQTVKIETSGSRVVQFCADDGIKRYSTFGFLKGDGDLSRFEITFVATLTRTPSSTNVLKWIIQTSSDGMEGTYSPSKYNVEASAISEVLRLDIRDGSYSFGQNLVLGELPKKPITILIE